MIYKTDEQLKEIYRKAQVKADNEIRNPYKILFYLKDSNDIEFSDIMNFMQYHDTDALNKIRFLLEREIFIRLREKEECTIKDYYSDEPDDIGDYGEKLTIFDLELLKVKGYNGNILHNLYIPYSNGKTSQIDILFINKKGIFVIESKNYSGWIFGSESDMYWTVCDRSKKWKMYNPILQNNGHINTINYHLRGIPCFSVVIFSERCELKKINLYSNTYVFKRNRTFFNMSNAIKNFPDVMNENQVIYVTDYLRQFCDADEIIKNSHIDDINLK